MDIFKLYNDCLSERNEYLDEAQQIAELTIPSLMPRSDKGSSVHSLKIGEATYGSKPVLNRPYSDAGARALKGFASTLVSTLSPSNVRFFRLIPDPTLPLDESQTKQVSEIFRKQEQRIESFLAQHNFYAFSNSCLRRLLVEGQEGIKVDAENGFMNYPLRALATKRHFGRLIYAIFEEVKTVKDENEPGKYKSVPHFIYVNYQTKEVWSQTKGQEKAKKTDESSRQYIIAVSDSPVDENYARAFYSDHLGLLAAINQHSEDLLTAEASCAWKPMIYSGPPEISTKQIAQTKSNEIMRLNDPTWINWVNTGGSISDWNFIWVMLKEKEETIQYISAAGLASRAGQIQTATEVNAIRSELDSLVGSTAQVISESYYKNVIIGVMEVLNIQGELKKAFADNGVTLTDEMVDKLVQPIVVSGTPALAREQDSQRLISGISSLTATFGPNATSIFDLRAVAKEFLDGLRINTEGLLTEPIEIPPEIMAQLPPEVQSLPPEQIMQYIQSQQPPQSGA